MNNQLSRIHSLMDSDGTTHLAEYTYLGRDRTVQVDFPQPGAKFTYIKQGSEGNGDGGDQYTGWDRFGRAIDLRWIKNSTSAHLERLQHGYDRASNRLYRKNLVAPDSARQDEFYAYDGLSQLNDLLRGVLNTGRTAITGTPAAEENFTYDRTANCVNYWAATDGSVDVEHELTCNLANELEAIDSDPSHVAEDAAGNMTKVTRLDDWYANYDLKYDAWNRLVEVKDGSTVVATYAYDGLNRRVTKTVGSTPRHFYYTDKWQIIEERIYTNTYADRQFVWGIRYTDDLVLRDKGTERLYVIQDYFQPTAVMSTGAVVERYGYEAFGTSRVMTPAYGSRDPSSYEWETRYGAYRWDGETQMLQVRNRYLHTRLGRWVTRDPIGYEGGINLYEYVGNQPIQEVDPTGYSARYIPPTGSVPYYPPSTPPAQDCVKDCISKSVLGISADTTVIVGGQPLLKKRFIMPGSTEGTSIIAKLTNQVMGDVKLPVRLPTISGGCSPKIAGTIRASTFISRWLPIVGWVLLAYDAAKLTLCIYQECSNASSGGFQGGGGTSGGGGASGTW